MVKKPSKLSNNKTTKNNKNQKVKTTESKIIKHNKKDKEKRKEERLKAQRKRIEKLNKLYQSMTMIPLEHTTQEQKNLYVTEKKQQLWALTTFFNPSKFNTKLTNYRKFRQSNKEQGLQLITIELSYNDEYELNNDDADILIQLKSDCVLWQKERLLNIALKHVPDTCTKICWVDADIIFKNNYWVYETSCILDTYPIIHPYQRVFRLSKDHLPKDVDPEEVTKKSLYGIIYDYNLTKKYSTNKPCGFVWAIQRSIIDQVGFYDHNIIGGGDRIMSSAIFSDKPTKELNDHQRFPYTPEHENEIKKYMKKLYQHIQGKPFYTRGVIFHLWHGSYANRQYSERHQILKNHNYDPNQDIIHAPNGCWQWNPNKPKPSLIQHIQHYFHSRSEDQ